MPDDSKILSIIKKSEQVLNKINGISSAKIITSQDGEISEIHVVSNSRGSKKSLVRCIESTLITFIGSELGYFVEKKLRK